MEANWRAAIAVGNAFALRITGANEAWGRNYSLAFSQWVKAHGFEKMRRPTRSVAVELHENISAIEAWRNALPERQRRRLIHLLSVTRRWRASVAHGSGKSPDDLKRDAVAALKRFVTCVQHCRPIKPRLYAKQFISKLSPFIAPCA